MPRIVIDTRDYRGERVILTAEKWKEKVKDHPELKDREFIDSISRTLKSPEVVYQDYDKPEFKRCYYKKFSSSDFTKVVIWNENDPPHRIVAAFLTNIIKEIKYKKLKIVYNHGR